MLRSLTMTVLLAFLFISGRAQIDSLVHSGKCLDKAKQRYDSGDYDLAIRELRKIDPRDTNYVKSLYELSRTYFKKKLYAEALEATKQGLSVPSPYKAALFDMQARSYAFLDDYARADSLLRVAMEEFPFDFQLSFRCGLVLYDQKKYDEAEARLFSTLFLNPYASNAHLYLAKIAMKRGQKTEAMFAMGVYLAINNTDNDELTRLEDFVKNALQEENTLPKSADNPFQRLDEILLAKISYEDDFTLRIPIDLGITRQYQMLFELLDEQKGAESNPWVKFYLPVYRKVKKEGSQDAFVYHIANSAPIEKIKQWVTNNEKGLQHFYSVMNDGLNEFRKIRVLPQRWGYDGPVKFSYYKDGHVQAIGNFDQHEKRTGKWYFLDENNTVLAHGNYEEGNKVGLWKYTSNSGIRTSDENLDTGEISAFNEEGNLHYHYFQKSRLREGDYQLYYSCGALLEERRYHNGKREGPGKTYYPDGKLEAEFEFRKDSLSGKFINWYDTGGKELEKEYINGHSTGKLTRYYPDGKISIEGQYKDGKATGAWTYYHPNGRIKKRGSYTNDLETGKWEDFNSSGELTGERPLEAGKLQGDENFYHNGHLHYTMRLKLDTIMEMLYYDPSGKVISKLQSSNGRLTGNGYFPDGVRQLELDYLNSERNGTWKYYYRCGNLSGFYHYENGKLHGDYSDYFEQGNIKVNAHYVHGQLDGYYQNFYSNGKVKTEGWYREGKKQQKWLTYFNDGTLSNDSYYLNGKLTGYSINYNLDGKPFSLVKYRSDGRVKSLTRFGRDGSVAAHSGEMMQKKIAMTPKYQNGATAEIFEYGCGESSGKHVNFLAGNKPVSERNYSNGKFNGKYFSGYPNGSVKVDGTYRNGEANGIWTWYSDNGAKYSQGRYTADERDSLWTYYYSNGKPMRTVPYREGLTHGESQAYGLDGNLVLEKRYDEDQLVAYRTTEKNGIMSDWTPFSGTGRITAHYNNGQIAIEEFYRCGLYDSTRKIYYPGGNLYSLYHHKNNLLTGESILYHSNGKVSLRMNYLDDYESGSWIYYNPDGTISKKENYTNGSLNGDVEFYLNGKKSYTQKFWGGNPTE